MGSGFRVENIGGRGSGSALRVEDSGFRVWVKGLLFGFGIQGLGSLHLRQ